MVRHPGCYHLNIHFHILFLDGVYVYRDNRPPRFQRVKAPDKNESAVMARPVRRKILKTTT